MALLLVNYAQIITLYENLHSGALGGLALTIAQILFLPNLVIWAACVAGRARILDRRRIDSSARSAPRVGPIPSIPVLGALPQGDYVFAFVGLLVPVLAGFLVGALLSGPLAARIRSTGRLAPGLRARGSAPASSAAPSSACWRGHPPDRSDPGACSTPDRIRSWSACWLPSSWAFRPFVGMVASRR